MSGASRELVLGVGAGIAAYKSCDLLRRLQDRGYSVTVVPTPSSLNFVGSATWAALSGRPVSTQVWENVHEVSHISIARTADFFLIAPATADLIARIAWGRADDLLTSLVLAAQVPILIVPAMHPSMWTAPATVANVALLRERGFTVMEPEIGRLTGSDIGQGRFPESSAIIKEFDTLTGFTQDLLGKRVLVTGGGTREAIDPVRFIGNRSSGKQALAVAKAALLRGAHVQLIAASIDSSDLLGVEVTHVESAEEMGQALSLQFPTCDILVMAAAVADAKPRHLHSEKIKKNQLEVIELEPTPDLLANLSAIKTNQIMIGFAAETSELIASASAKLIAKGLDVIYVNDVSGGAIFGKDTTQGMIISRTGAHIALKEVSKDALANLLLDHAVRQLG
ncbi:MAG: bifunctional phosphopantothenoylcysteine decarboxylase/phosphopantothenate--cysteine ligase CoaBC [Candidatus Planktophila sp.]|nr:bifunctional phosphopantothenoylcysteine decarboxylase/phosphopantothenate--cysteine ligase CoaBC [Candidatus Planktophila sp.]